MILYSYFTMTEPVYDNVTYVYNSEWAGMDFWSSYKWGFVYSKLLLYESI